MLVCAKIRKNKSFISGSVALVNDLPSALQINTSNSQPSADSGGEVTDITAMAVPIMRNLRRDASDESDGRPGMDVSRLAAAFGKTQKHNEKDVPETTVKLRTKGDTNNKFKLQTVE